ncbi:retrovirus-related Pol polyprotein from type-2 retrotransposable element R2DM, partial [Haematococcus lacustris]
MTTYLDNNCGSTCALGSSCHSPCLPAWRIDGPHRTPPVTPDQGVKQGCPISPLLFALYVHDISKEFIVPVDAVRVQGTLVTHFMYADDLTLVSTSPHGLQWLVCQLQGFADRNTLQPMWASLRVMDVYDKSYTAAPSIGYKHEILSVSVRAHLKAVWQPGMRHCLPWARCAALQPSANTHAQLSQLAARELLGDEFTLSSDMVLGTKALEVKWLERWV